VKVNRLLQIGVFGIFAAIGLFAFQNCGQPLDLSQVADLASGTSGGGFSSGGTSITRVERFDNGDTSGPINGGYVIRFRGTGLNRVASARVGDHRCTRISDLALDGTQFQCAIENLNSYIWSSSPDKPDYVTNMQAGPAQAEVYTGNDSRTGLIASLPSAFTFRPVLSLAYVIAGVDQANGNPQFSRNAENKTIDLGGTTGFNRGIEIPLMIEGLGFANLIKNGRPSQNSIMIGSVPCQTDDSRVNIGLTIRCVVRPNTMTAGTHLISISVNGFSHSMATTDGNPIRMIFRQ